MVRSRMTSGPPRPRRDYHRRRASRLSASARELRARRALRNAEVCRPSREIVRELGVSPPPHHVRKRYDSIEVIRAQDPSESRADQAGLAQHDAFAEPEADRHDADPNA